MTHEHRYAPGWLPDNMDIDWWHESSGQDAWRYCPACGRPLWQEFASEAPRCSGCNRPFSTCPCACLAAMTPPCEWGGIVIDEVISCDLPDGHEGSHQTKFVDNSTWQKVRTTWEIRWSYEDLP